MNGKKPPAISVVMPVLNAAPFVVASARSVLDHTSADIELIVVDDGSTDGSVEILEQLAASDERVRLISFGCRQGQSQARNKGFDNARGDYVFCLDADDAVPPGALDRLLAAATSTNCELTMGKLLWLKDAAEAEAPLPHESGGPTRTAVIQESRYLQTLPNCHCCNLYSRALLERHRIRYALDLSLGADQLFQAETIIHAGQVAMIDDVVYVYHHYRGNSVTKRPPSLKSLVDDIEFHGRVARLYEANGLEDAARRLMGYWTYAIREYWLQIPSALTRADAVAFFTRFRSMVDEFNITEWHDSTPAHHRHVLALVVAGRDDQALAFLATDEALTGIPAEPPVRQFDIGATSR